MKKFIIILLTIVLLILIIIQLIRVEKAKVDITEQSIKIFITPAEHIARIENDVSFITNKTVDEIKFLLNENVKIRKIEQDGISLSYDLKKEFDITEYASDIDSTTQDEYKNAAELQIYFPNSQKEGQITLYYSLLASEEVDKAAFSREYIAYKVKGYIGKKGVFISPSYFWYPTLPNDHSYFDILISTPDTLQILTQGKLISEEVIDNTRKTNWKIDYPGNGVHLVGSKYIVQEQKYKDISIYTYFFPESQDLAESYLSACQRYLGMYEKLIGPYPFSKFAVVENFFPTGYGMPSYTLLGSQVIRLPFIIYTSLGHEVAHNWWGNSVYIDYDSGNWCEGLTTYFADHYYKEQKSPSDAIGYRRDINRDFTVYVKDLKDFPLSQFSERTESSSRAIGYGKSAMVFHQLRKILGDSLFFESFRAFYKNYRFKDASWADIKGSAEQTSGKNLDWFFEQWVERKGAPRLDLGAVTFTDNLIRIILRQDEDDIYRLYVPVKITLNDSSILKKNVWLEKAQQTFEFPIQGIPKEIAIDPDFDFLRKLQRSEIPPSLSEIYAEEEVIHVLPDKVSEAKLDVYKQFAETMSNGDEGATVIKANEISDSQIESSSMYILGNPSENSLFNKVKLEDQTEFQITDLEILLNNAPTPTPDDVTVLAARAMDNGKSVCIITIGENQQTGRIANLLSHYGKYSYLIFSNGRNQVKEIYTSSKSPMMYSFE
jgi:hypothetical protein